MTQSTAVLGVQSVDLFGRLRVSNPTTLYDAKQIHDKQPLLWDEELFGGASAGHSAVNAATTLATSSSGDAVIRQTFSRYNYQPGKSQLTFMTFRAPKESNVRKRIGLFHTSNAANSVPQNGVYLEVTGDDVVWNIAKNGVVTESASQEDWNITQLERLDIASAQILFIAYEWLGVGTVQVGFVIEGNLVPVHEFQHADNGFSTVYMSTPNLPLGYSIYQSGTGSGELDAICASVISEGGSDTLGVTRSADMGTTKVTAAAVDTTYALLGVRLKETHFGTSIVPQRVNAISTSQNNAFLLKLIFNPTVAGTFTYADLANSSVQVAVGVQANTVTGGTVLWSNYASAASREASIASIALPRIGVAIDGTADSLVVAVQPVAVNADVLASFGWIEQV